MSQINIPSASTQGPPAVLATEYDGAIGTILNRIQAAYPKYIDLSLTRLISLLARLGNPERKLPPVIHVAGTNGKGSTCAFLRAMAEAGGLHTHVMTSPHLVSVTERFRLNGALVTEDRLFETMLKVETLNDGAPITVFEILTAAGFLLFSQEPADLAIIEVGLGGRLDATNVVAAPSVSVITHIGLDHQSFLGDTIPCIAAEKAGIIKPGCPVVSAQQPPEAARVIADICRQHEAPLWRLGQEVNFTRLATGEMAYHDPIGSMRLPKPALTGVHQYQNAALAVAALRASSLKKVPTASWGGLSKAVWPGRLQRLHGALAQLLPSTWSLWLDGGHNPHAAEALRHVLEGWSDAPLHLLIGMKSSKDIAGFIQPLLPFAATVQAVAEPGQYDAVPISEIIAASEGVATNGPDIRSALKKLSGPTGRVLVCGSLYLAGAALKLDDIAPS